MVIPRLRVQGYTDLGGIIIPPLPVKCALTDRSSGLFYEIIKSGADPVANQITDTSGFTVFTPNFGPYIGPAGSVRRLFTSGGTLNSEAVPVSVSGGVFVVVSENPLDVWEVTWDGASLTLTEVV